LNIRDDINKYGAEAAYALAVNFPEFYVDKKEKENGKVKYYDWAYATRKIKLTNPENVKLELNTEFTSTLTGDVYELKFESNGIKFRIRNSYYSDNQWHILQEGEEIQYIDLQVSGEIFYQKHLYDEYLKKVKEIKIFSVYDNNNKHLSDFYIIYD